VWDKAMAIDLAQLSVSDLKQLQKDIGNEFKSRESRILKEAREEVRAIEVKYGLTIEDILAGKKSSTSVAQNVERKKVDPKYRNPENSSETWTGRGKKPVWFEKAIQNGKKPEDLLI
jgi:DNA-binding protein H-NS